MNYLNIVHISDLHLKTSETTGRFNQSIIIDALIDDLRIQANGPLRPSLIVFSGDLVNAADDPDIFEEGALILEEIAKACSLTSDHVFLCPGNHDASRISIGPSIPRLSDYRKKAKSVDGANDLYRNQDFVADVGKTFGKFNKLYAHFGKKFQVQADFLTQAYDIPEFDISIICLNSATLTGAGVTPDLKDEHNLFVSEISLSKIIKKMPTRKASIYIGHHPFSFLNENNDAVFRTLVFKHADIYLSGHLHAARPEFVHAPQGKTSLIQAGSLYAQRDWWNGYSIISVVPDKPHHRVTYRKFHEARRAFGLATEFSDTGEVFSSDAAENFWLSIRPKVNLDKIEAWRITKLIPHIGDECGKDKSGVFDGTRFVEPEFEKDRYVNTENGMERISQPETISFSDIFQQHENFVIFARSESGKTTLIREWARRLSCLASSSIGWKVPVILKASEIKSYKSGIDRLIRQKLPEMIDGLTHMDLLEAGLLTVFIDDANIEASSVKDSIDNFVKTYPGNRYIFLTSSIYLQGAGIAPVVVKGITFSHVRLKQLKTSQLLVLIENHGTKDPAVADRLLQRMVQEATNLNVPITPVTGTFLIQIYTEDNSTDLINRANLVERYVEISLEKFAPAELLPSSFDFHNKSDLLGFVASEMARRGVYDIREEECLKWISEYLNEYGLRFSTVDLLNYFVQARILERSDGMVSFRLNAFIEFFAAKRMVDDDSFREFILDENNYLKFTNEISFYAAISRKNKSVLVEIFERYKRDAAEAWDALPDIAKKGTALEDIFLPSPDASMAEVRQIEDKVFNKTLSEQERREALDEDSPVIPTNGKKLDRQNSDIDPGQRWVRQLTLLSAMLKNMELVSSSVKTTILTEVVQGWLQFLSMSMGLVPELSERRRLKFAGVEYIVLFPEDMESADIARRLMLAMPISTAKIANHHLGTEKLRVQLESGIGSETGFSPSQQFMRGAILAQLGLDDLSKVLHKVSEAIEGKLYLNEVFYRLLAELVIRYRLPEAESQNIKNLAAETMVRLQGKSGKNAHALRNQVFKSLETSRLRVQIGEREGPKSLGKR